MEDELRVRLNDHQPSKIFPVKPKSTPKPLSKPETPDSRYWSSFKPHSVPNLVSSVSAVAFSPIHPHSFAVAHSTTVSLFSSNTLTASRRFSFKDVVSSVSFRSDGALLAASDLSGTVQVFDVKERMALRSLRSHKAAASSVRVVGGSNGMVFAGKKKKKVRDEEEKKKMVMSFWSVKSEVDESRRRALRPSYFRYFQRGQSEKPSKDDYLVKERKGVKLTRHDKLLKKFRHKEALVSVLEEKKPADVVAVMEELVARRKIVKCVSNLEEGELGLLLSFLQRYCTVERYSKLLMALTKKVLETRGEDINGKEEFKGILRNLKREVNQEIKIQQSLLEIQGVIAPLMRIAGR
ncbi:hypothetical protein DY000_02000250 [Brassica cretica]|uniref:U3 small nucleolar RNA-associated protein 15 C-terminal domain-containing protein n=1 Tax=Brassica cretica TaxID=69181 RepID=A0ABQ7BZD9_BRACR|nr:hypothetical protein DY000_02000250 [Brassica cretica]